MLTLTLLSLSKPRRSAPSCSSPGVSPREPPKTRAIASPYSANNENLTDRELDVLRLIREGLLQQADRRPVVDCRNNRHGNSTGNGYEREGFESALKRIFNDMRKSQIQRGSLVKMIPKQFARSGSAVRRKERIPQQAPNVKDRECRPSTNRRTPQLLRDGELHEGLMS